MILLTAKAVQHHLERYQDNYGDEDLAQCPGDRAGMRGAMQSQTVALENGEQRSVNQLFVTSIEVVSRSKHKSREKAKGGTMMVPPLEYYRPCQKGSLF